MGLYILDEDGNMVPCEDIRTWGAWLEKAYETGARRVGFDELSRGTYVSTVFLGLDHSYSMTKTLDHKPLIWETMIFGGHHDQYQKRYETREQAQEGHKIALALAKSAEPPRGSLWNKYQHLNRRVLNRLRLSRLMATFGFASPAAKSPTTSTEEGNAPPEDGTPAA